MTTVPYTIRLPENLHAALKRVADDGDRSLNRQILRLLEQGVRAELHDAEAILSADSATDQSERPVPAKRNAKTQVGES